MKRILKYLSYLFLILLFFLIAAVFFFSNKYEQKAEEINATQLQAAKENIPSYEFNLNPDTTNELALLPVPKNIERLPGEFLWPNDWLLITNNSMRPYAEKWTSQFFIKNVEANAKKKRLRFAENKAIAEEGYELKITPNGIEIQYSDPAGAYYGMVTLHHLQIQFPTSIYSLKIIDEPDLEIRGAMLDISRDKVPKLNTLKKIVDQLSLLKYNHLQLYVEGFSFGYPSFKNLWENKETPITPEEIRVLDQYCQERFIELVPNQNSLGHMAAWLETDKYKDLAECPEGYEIFPMTKMKTTLDPENKETIILLEKMMDDLLPNFNSTIFNANLDEPFELGHCKNKLLADEIGVGQIYINHVLKIYELAKERGKSMWMWGDIINKHPELLDQLPNDVTLLEWGYEAEHPYAEHTGRIKEKGIPFLVCPGTSSWMSLTGRTENMLGNIENAVRNGIKNGAKGMLLTDWGDMGHWQYLPVSYPGFIYAGTISWNSRASKTLSLEKYLNLYFLKDQHQELAEIILDAGRYNKFEERNLPNMNLSFMAYQFGLSDPVLEQAIYGAIEQKMPELGGESAYQKMKPRFKIKQPLQMDSLNAYLNNLEIKLNQNQREGIMAAETEIDLVKDELRNGIQMVRLGAEIRNYGQQKKSWPSEERINYLTNMQERLSAIQEKHRELWLKRNKPGGLDRSMQAFTKLDQQLINQLKIERGGKLGKKAEQLKGKIIAGGASWYLE